MKLKEINMMLPHADQEIRIDISLYTSSDEISNEEYLKQSLEDIANARITTIQAENDLLVIEVDPGQEG